MISKELNKKMGDLFVYFDPVPMASGKTIKYNIK